MTDTVESLIEEIGQSVFIYVERRNEDHEWTVGLTHDPLIHEHWPSLLEGLVWLRDNKPRFEEWRAEIGALTDRKRVEWGPDHPSYDEMGQ